ncbi:MAG: ribosomal protein S18-alanine N-acetyltransferase [Frankiaceae bacterium]|nr:ribosomal protein S18-alanine N-acetyltransferase [Frankiaceae bacterium]
MRAMLPADIEGVMVLEQELFGDESWSATMFASELAETATRMYLVDETDGVITAYAGLCAYAPYEAYVQTMAVAPAQQGKGVGSALLKELIDEAQRRGCEHLDLEVRADNDIAQRLYARNGFAKIAVRRKYYQPSGTDAIVMRKELSP